jgi:hypothetical protein
VTEKPAHRATNRNLSGFARLEWLLFLPDKEGDRKPPRARNGQDCHGRPHSCKNIKLFQRFPQLLH